ELFHRALDLNPSYATTHQWLGEILLFMRRFDEAQEQLRMARELDPLSLIIQEKAARGDFFAGRYDAAIAQYRDTLQRDPDFGIARIFLGKALIEKKQYGQAL